MPPVGIRFESEAVDKRNNRREKSTCKGCKGPYMQADSLFLLAVFQPASLLNQTLSTDPYCQPFLTSCCFHFHEFSYQDRVRQPCQTRFCTLTFRQICRKVSARRRHGGLGRAPASAVVIQMLCLRQCRHRRLGSHGTPELYIFQILLLFYTVRIAQFTFRLYT